MRHIHLDICSGKILTLIGKNGSGKSTIAKIVLHILQPTEGKVERKVAMKVGYVPQKIKLDPAFPLTIARLMELTQPISPQIIHKALQEVNMQHMGNVNVSNLSGGEIQRVLIARASVHKPDLLVLDEPLQGIDFSDKKILYNIIKKYPERFNCGIMLISHDLDIALSISDHVLYLPPPQIFHA
ncbi:MAG: zinc transport system ATP-binding protein [Candidatus Tokpelaia sp. JSC161]|nr:MAG: zinc transport system ATP-binding protein [Candidatus Tokpelaia sp. JSC161]